MLKAASVVVPKAWDPRAEKGHRHYVEMYADLTPPEFASKMRAVFSSMRHAVVPSRMGEIAVAPSQQCI